MHVPQSQANKNKNYSSWHLLDFFLWLFSVLKYFHYFFPDIFMTCRGEGGSCFLPGFSSFPRFERARNHLYFIFLSQHSSAQQTNNQSIVLMISLNWFKVPKILRFSTKEPCNNTFKYHERPSYYLCHKKYTFPLKTLCEIYINQRTYLS